MLSDIVATKKSSFAKQVTVAKQVIKIKVGIIFSVIVLKVVP
jgi:hypothetical protein